MNYIWFWMAKPIAELLIGLAILAVIAGVLGLGIVIGKVWEWLHHN